MKDFHELLIKQRAVTDLTPLGVLAKAAIYFLSIPSLYAVHMAVELRGKGAVRAGGRSQSGKVAPLAASLAAPSASSLPWTPLCEDIQWNLRLRVSIGLRVDNARIALLT